MRRIGGKRGLAAVAEVRVTITVPSRAGNAADTARTAGGTVDCAADRAAIAAIVGVSVRIDFAPIGGATIAVAVAGIARDTADTSGTSGGAVGATAHGITASAMRRTVKIGFATIGGVTVTIAEASSTTNPPTIRGGLTLSSFTTPAKTNRPIPAKTPIQAQKIVHRRRDLRSAHRPISIFAVSRTIRATIT